ncbi:50S ribosomal protein L29 [Trichlorobacter lovleyi]|uniref:Large ribosomal subunit protein uL29 n=1 Tax=Trichlorobacter lovleyi (strain ATCC BAA-1151 / DSM 17278 / SZ) TaxID=398767 RepID=RL29_TRIL1|nr:50S ribosomal protein L29 [Trichlorobacter lovleyi]B3E7U3.1 RecName: Full=Large ribosomal subunit protein uL29; AltName: Full=50S ribosomal protein L29 [Trichlorobacter lovleyi SZ]ACD95075.1 ribosomal protein L29 [Trichlorobacter lovleyi SZ]
MKANDFRKMAEAELKQKRDELTQELFNLKFQLNTGRLENTGKLGAIRKDIARINTILTESRG